ncbi:unnamed protein product [Gongylonema pulchrum]|uniref:tRNA (uracil(54)-C(5))-methyltransferase n=1 Tax=Gongylonema pulchrum TaxID=637853 RepID=A0A3P7NAN0_9BILA|nr:unnamed protein product [Gongylonema pulchrum]
MKTSEVKNITRMGITVFFSLPTPHEAAAAVQVFNGFAMKGRVLRAKIAGPKPREINTAYVQESGGEQVRQTARERVTPLADKPYSEQLEIKMNDLKRTAANFVKGMIDARVQGANEINIDELIEPIRPSPRVTAYRNKCEFTIGRDIDENVCVGFVGGRFSQNQHYVVPVDSCDNISSHMKRVVKAFERFVIETGEALGCDMMMIVTVFPTEDSEREKELIRLVEERFLDLNNFFDENSRFRVTSLYWQRLANASDPPVYEHIAGAPYIYEMILGSRFRVSPSSFFQTNSAAAGVLYRTIAEKCGLCESGYLRTLGKANTGAGASGKDVKERPGNEKELDKKRKCETVMRVY